MYSTRCQEFSKLTYAILFVTLLAISGLAQTAKETKRQRKEQEKAMMEQPLEATIKAGPEKIKAVILQTMLNLGYDPDKDSSYQLTFTGEAKGRNAAAYRLGRAMGGSEPEEMLEEIRFVIIPGKGTTKVEVIPSWVSESHRGATTRTQDNTKDTHRDILQILETVKAQAEQ
jgi:hypothetical protein